MKYYLFPLSFKEQENPANKGFRYALENKSRWVEMGEAQGEVNTYDRGTTNLVYKKVAYNIFKDYVSIDENYRVYIGCDLNLSYDRLTEEELKIWGSTSNTKKVSDTRTITTSTKISDAISGFGDDTGVLKLEAGTYTDAIKSTIPSLLTILGNDSGKDATSKNRATDIITNESIISGPIKFTGESYVTINGVTFTKNATIELNDFTGSLTLTNCKFVGLTGTNGISADKSSRFKLMVSSCYFGTCTVTNGIHVAGNLTKSSGLVHNMFSNSFCTGKIVSLCDNEDSDLTIIGNECAKPNLLQMNLTKNSVFKVAIENNKFKSMTTPFVNIDLDNKCNKYRNISVIIKGTEMDEGYEPVKITTTIPDDKKAGRLPVIKK